MADFNNAAVRAVRADGVRTLARGIPKIVGLAAYGGKIFATSYEVNRLVTIEAGQVTPWIGRELAPLEGVAADSNGVVLADAGNYRVVRIAYGTSQLTQLLGDGRYGDSPARVSLPRGVARFGQAWAVADTGHHRILLAVP